jgi:hypothetical protein
MTKTKVTNQIKMTTLAKTTIFCLVAGMLAGFFRGFDFLGESLKILLPGLLFGIALPVGNWKLYQRPSFTLLGFAIVSTAIYPMIVVLALRFFGEEIGSDLVSKMPYSLGILPSLVGASLLYFVYKTFLGKHNSRFFIIYLSISVFVGIIFFPLMNFANNFVLSLGLWQAGIGFGLTYLHFLGSD